MRTAPAPRAEETALPALFAGGFFPHSSAPGPSGGFRRPQRGGRVKMATLAFPSPPRLGRRGGRPSSPNMAAAPPTWRCFPPPSPPNMAAAPQRPKMAARRLRAASAALPLPEEPQRDGTRRDRWALRRVQPLFPPPRWAAGWRCR